MFYRLIERVTRPREREASRAGDAPPRWPRRKAALFFAVAVVGLATIALTLHFERRGCHPLGWNSARVCGDGATLIEELGDDLRLLRAAGWANRFNMHGLSARLYVAAADANPASASLYYQFASAQWLMAGQFARADAAFERFTALTLDPPPNAVSYDREVEDIVTLNRRHYLLNRAATLAQRRRLDQAEATLSEAEALARNIESSQERRAFRYHEAEVLAALGQSEAAIDSIDIVIASFEDELASIGSPASADDSALQSPDTNRRETNFEMAQMLIRRIELTADFPERARSDDAERALAALELAAEDALLRDRIEAERGRLARAIGD